jgi:hypothetical protein
MKAAIYARVSTVDQKCEMQLRELREYCTRRGWEIAGEYVDTGWSGTKASRPQLDENRCSGFGLLGVTKTEVIVTVHPSFKANRAARLRDWRRSASIRILPLEATELAAGIRNLK